MTVAATDGVKLRALPKRRRRVHGTCIYGVLALLCSTTNLAAFNLPVANPDSATMQHEQKIWIPVLANDTGDFEPAYTQVVTQPAHGSATVGADGRILYANDAGDTSTADTFTYRNGWSSGSSNVATVTIGFTTNLRFFAGAPAIPVTSPNVSVQVTRAFGNLSFDKPVCLTAPPGDAQRLFVVQKSGQIKVIPDITAVAPTSDVFLDLSAVLTTRGETLTSTMEEGLLGLAFHPEYAENRYFYVFYTVKKADNLVYERLSRFTTQADNPNAADPYSELILLEQYDRAVNHNAGCVAFGPDGYLYVSLGDEGIANDIYGNAQRIDLNFFSGLLRIDVDKKPGSLEPNAHATVPRDGGHARYGVPPDNPFVGATTFNGQAVTPANVRTEFWAVGLRNPWRFSFDPLTGNLWLGDVGQDAWEEVDLITRGGNYGWSFFEGRHPGTKTAPGGFTGIAPVYEYQHAVGNFSGFCVIGGIVYRGTALAGIDGDYIFGDYVTSHIWALHKNGASVTVQLLADSVGVVAFAPNPATQEVLMANFDQGKIQQLTPILSIADLPANLSATGLFTDLSDLSPAPGVVRYSVNLPAWNDYAQTQHWFAMPDATSRMTWAKNGAWVYPTGMVWVQQLDVETVRGDPLTKRHVETRILVKTADGAYGASYLWNDEQTDATLVSSGGASISLNITAESAPFTKVWTVPSRADCLRCHNTNAGYALSFNTPQLNRVENMNSFVGNQIALLAQYGYFSNEPDPADTLPRYVAPTESSYSLEARARSYLAVNCASCHQAGGATGAAWDVRPELSLNLTALVNAAIANNANNDDDNRALVPGDAYHSVILNRVTEDNGFTRMPPLGVDEIDYDGADVLVDWITQELPSWQNYDAWRADVFADEPPPAGDANADDDVDGASNFSEFLAGTSPLENADVLQFNPSPVGSDLYFHFTLPLFRAFQIETSLNLRDWSPLDFPGNDGLAPSDGDIHFLIPAPPPGSPHFYRLRLWEN